MILSKRQAMMPMMTNICRWGEDAVYRHRFNDLRLSSFFIDTEHSSNIVKHVRAKILSYGVWWCDGQRRGTMVKMMWCATKAYDGYVMAESRKEELIGRQTGWTDRVVEQATQETLKVTMQQGKGGTQGRACVVDSGVSEWNLFKSWTCWDMNKQNACTCVWSKRE